MSVELEPSELGFKRPYTEEVSQILRLRNTHDEPVAFKVKTTAPKQYCVRPNSGSIRPGEVVNVSVVLQPMKQDPPPDARCKDKFLVQSVKIPVSKETPQWADLEKNYKSAIVERKIRVLYLAADGASSAANGVDEHIDDSTLNPPPVYTPHAQTSSTFAATPASTHQGSRSTEDDSQVHQTPTSGAQTVVEQTREELKKLLADARATIVKLKNDAADSAGLRRRNVGGSAEQSSGSSLATQQAHAPATGVSVQTTALIALFVFIFTYLLF